MKNIILIIILTIGFGLRLYRADSYPPLLWDEAAVGYNAFSLLQTGRDEYGTVLPLILKSFGDYKPGIYAYLSIPFIAVFGLNPLSVRLPSIIIGSLLSLLVYLLIRHLYPQKKYLGLIAAFIAATNPINIHFSRGAWETNILLFQLVLGSYLFLKKRYFLSAFTFILGLYTYQSAKMFVPFLIFNLFFLSFLQAKKILFTKFQIIFLLIMLVGLIPLAYGLVSQSNSNRLQVLSLFSYPPSDGQNKYIYFTQEVLSRYFNHFSPRLLLTEGDWPNPRHSAPYIGIILIPSFIFLLIGLFFSSTKNKSVNIFFLLWLLFSPLPAALTRDQVQTVRTLPITIPLIFFISLGLNHCLTLFTGNFRKIFLSATLIIYTVSLCYYLDLYYQHMVKKSPTDFLYGYQSAIDFLTINTSKFDQVYFTNYYGQPYIFYLFFNHYPAQKYQQQAKLSTNSVDVGQVEKIDNINFNVIDWHQLKPKTLLIISLEEYRRLGLTPEEKTKFTPLSPLGDISTFYAYETN